MIAVEGKNHATLVSDPDGDMVQRILDFLRISDEGSYEKWLQDAQMHAEPALQKMLVNPGKGAAGIEGEAKAFFGHLFHTGEELMDGWQQFVVHA